MTLVCYERSVVVYMVAATFRIDEHIKHLCFKCEFTNSVFISKFNTAH